MFPVKRLPMLPTIMMHRPHSKDRNKYKKKPHDTKAPRGLHGCSNEQLNVCHDSSCPCCSDSGCGCCSDSG